MRALLFAAGLACIAAQDPCPDGRTSINVQLQWVQQAQFAGFYAALENRYYRDACLDVSIKPGPVDTIEELRLRRADIAVMWTSRLIGAASGNTSIQGEACGGTLPTKRYTNIMQHFQRSGYQHVQWKDSGIDEVDKLRGKSVGYWPDLDAEIVAALGKSGLDHQTDVDMQSIMFTVTPFLERKVDSMPVLTYNELAQILESPNPAASAAAGRTVLYTMDDLWRIDLNEISSMLPDGVVVSHDWLELPGNRDVAQRFVTASMRGWMYCRDNEGACVDILFAGSAHQRWQMREVNRLLWPSDMTMPPRAFQQTIDVMREFNLYDTSDPTMVDYLREGGVYISNFTETAKLELMTRYGLDASAPYPERPHVEFCPVEGDDGKSTFMICVDPLSTSVDVAKIGGIAGGCAAALLIIVAVAVKMMRDAQLRKMGKLVSDHKVAEDCAQSIMDMRFDDVEYLTKLAKPTRIQKSFIGIVKMMVQLRSFIPNSLLANIDSTAEMSDSDAEDGSQSIVVCQQESLSIRSGHSHMSKRSTKQRSATVPIGGTLNTGPTMQAVTKEVAVVRISLTGLHFVRAKGDELKIPSLMELLAKTVLEMANVHKGVADFTGDGDVSVTFNAVRPIRVSSIAERAGHMMLEAQRRLDLAVTSATQSDDIVHHLSTASICVSPMFVGTVGAPGLRKFHCFGPGMVTSGILQFQEGVFDVATGRVIVMNERAHELGKHLFHSIFFESVTYNSQIYLIAVLRGVKASTNEEWMYELDARETKDPYSVANDSAWKAFKEQDTTTAAEQLEIILKALKTPDTVMDPLLRVAAERLQTKLQLTGPMRPT